MRTEARIHELYIYAALLLALLLGFSVGSVLVLAPAVGRSGEWFEAWVQVHGHVQLVGWVGVFVLGVGLFFIPRLRGTVLAQREFTVPGLAILTVGILLRAFSQLTASTIASTPFSAELQVVNGIALSLSGALEILGFGLLVYVLAVTFGSARPLSADAPIKPVMPFLITSAVSLSFALVVNAVLVLNAGIQGLSIVSPKWNNIFTHLMIFGFVIPMAFALSIRNLPLFMRLSFPPKEKLPAILVAFTIGVGFRIASFVLAHPFAAYASGIGMMLEGASILYFIWAFDVLLRRKRPWTTSRIPPPPDYVETRRPTRPGYPDYGEYGRFELLVTSSYAWLAVGALIALINGTALVFQSSPPIFADAERHSITLGFVTLLIFGMAVRMLPGFSGKNRIASTRLVLATFWLGNAAALSRVLLLLLPDLPGANVAYASSGILGWLAVSCLGANLWRTFHMEGRGK